MTRLPNIISCSRIIFSALLLFAADNPVGFVVLYCICGLTDIVDGYLARGFDAASSLGSRLDSIGDLVFFAVWIYLFFRYVKGESLPLTVAWMMGVAVIRMANLMITKVKFGQWGMMHTIGNKTAGLALYVALPLYVFANNAPLWSLWAIGFISAMSALEETSILLRHTDYNPDRRSILSNTSHLRNKEH